jgi:type II secretory pathway pseudopilin PulG
VTAKTTKEAADAAREREPDGEADEVEAVASEQDEAVEDAAAAEAGAPEQEEHAEGGAEDGPGQAAGRPAAARPKRKRRVRVIEVIDDDDDLEDVLEAIEAEDDEDEPPARPARAARPAAKTVKTAKPAAKASPARPAAAARPRPERLEPPEEAEDEPADHWAERPARKVGPFSYTPARSPKEHAEGSSPVRIVVTVVVVALLASLAIWQWTRASDLSSKQDARDAVSKVALQYGDVAFNYNAANYQSQADKAEKLMAGDLLDQFKQSTLPGLTAAFKSDSQVGMSSKSTDVFVGSVNGKFATVVVMVDIGLQTKDGKVSQPSTLLRLALAKVDGKWKVTKQYPSGVNDSNQNNQGGNGLVPGSSAASPSPSTTKSGKP